MPKAKATAKAVARQARVNRRIARRQLGRLGDNIVTPRMLALYTEHCGRFCRLAFGTSSLPRRVAPEDVDDALVVYLEILWEEGEPKSWASYTLAGAQHFAPRLRRHLPAAWRLRAAWDRLELPARAPPLTLDAVQALAGLACEIGFERVGAGLMLAFHCFLRTGELLMVRAGDFEFDRRCRSGVVNLHVTKGGVRRVQQEMVTIDDAELVQWLARLCGAMLPGDTLIDVSQSRFRSIFVDLCLTLQLAAVRYKPYSLRRGGATYHYRRYGNLDATALRGRWACFRTARIYVTDGLAAQQEINFTDEHWYMFRRFRRSLARAASGQQG